MELIKQVCSPDQAKRLYELGLRKRTYFSWVQLKEGQWSVATGWWLGQEGYYPAYSVAELGELLPRSLDHHLNEHSSYYILYGYDGEYNNPMVCYEDNDLSGNEEMLISTSGKTEAIARAAMLIWLLEEGWMKIE